MTTAPTDLLAIRADLMMVTGLHGDAIGIVGDAQHHKTGGYHLGRSDLAHIGHYHPQANPGSTREDYSTRLGRDRHGLSECASAMDVGGGWRNGGNAAWLRFNRLLVSALRAGNLELAGIRGVNFTPDGRARLRVDRENHWRADNSADSVLTHTHVEWYRDTEGHRAGPCRARLLQLAHQAVVGDKPPAPHPVPPSHLLEDPMFLDLAVGVTHVFSTTAYEAGSGHTRFSAASDFGDAKVRVATWDTGTRSWSQVRELAVPRTAGPVLLADADHTIAKVSILREAVDPTNDGRAAVGLTVTHVGS